MSKNSAPLRDRLSSDDEAASRLRPAGFDPSRGVLQYRLSWPRNPSPCDLVPLWAGEFCNFDDWVSFATHRLSGAAGDRYGAMQAVCIDAIGRRCTIGAHFMRARDEGTFPVRYFWECVPASATEAEGGDAKQLRAQHEGAAREAGDAQPETSHD